MSTRKLTWEKEYSVVEPQINAEGVHVWPFDPSFPIDIRFFDLDGRRVVRRSSGRTPPVTRRGVRRPHGRRGMRLSIAEDAGETTIEVRAVGGA